MQANQGMSDTSNGWSEPNDGYQVPPTVRFNINGEPVQMPQPAPMPQPSYKQPQRWRSPSEGGSPFNLPAPVAANRPAWMPLAVVGIPSAAVAFAAVAIAISSNSGGAVQKSSMEGITAIAMEATRSRGDMVCVSFSCDKFADAVQSSSKQREIQGGNLGVKWGDVEANMSSDVQAAPAPVGTPAVPQGYAIAKGIDGGGVGVNLYNGDQVINTIPKGDRLIVKAQKDGWSLVEWVGAGGATGWVKSEGIN